MVIWWVEAPSHLSRDIESILVLRLVVISSSILTGGFSFHSG